MDKNNKKKFTQAKTQRASHRVQLIGFKYLVTPWYPWISWLVEFYGVSPCLGYTQKILNLTRTKHSWLWNLPIHFVSLVWAPTAISLAKAVGLAIFGTLNHAIFNGRNFVLLECWKPSGPQNDARSVSLALFPHVGIYIYILYTILYYYIIVYYIVWYYTILYYPILYYITIYYIILSHIILYYILLSSIILDYSVLY